MEIFKLVIDKSKEYSVLFYDDTFDYPTFGMVIEGTSADKFYNEFKNIKILEIFDSKMNLKKSTTKYSEIQGTESIPYGTYVDDGGKSIACIRVILKEADVVERVEKIESLVFNELDVDSMSLEEFKDYKKSLISEACEEAIHKGVKVETPYGEENFTYYLEDQVNFSDMNAQIEAGFETIPYHSSKTNSKITSPCKTYDAKVIKQIYVAQLMNKFKCMTKCNQLYLWIDGIDNKTEISPITFESELIEPYLTAYNNLIKATEAMMSSKDMTKTLTQTISEAMEVKFGDINDKFIEVNNTMKASVTEVFNENKETIKGEVIKVVNADLQSKKDELDTYIAKVKDIISKIPVNLPEV